MHKPLERDIPVGDLVDFVPVNMWIKYCIILLFIFGV